MYSTIEMNYRRGLWTEAMVRVAVRKGVISEAECEAILSGAEQPGASASEIDEILDIVEGK